MSCCQCTATFSAQQRIASGSKCPACNMISAFCCTCSALWWVFRRELAWNKDYRERRKRENSRLNITLAHRLTEKSTNSNYGAYQTTIIQRWTTIKHFCIHLDKVSVLFFLGGGGGGNFYFYKTKYCTFHCITLTVFFQSFCHQFQNLNVIFQNSRHKSQNRPYTYVS